MYDIEVNIETVTNTLPISVDKFNFFFCENFQDVVNSSLPHKII